LNFIIFEKLQQSKASSVQCSLSETYYADFSIADVRNSSLWPSIVWCNVTL